MSEEMDILERLAEEELSWGEKIERQGVQEGLRQGKLQGKFDILVRLLTLRFGELPTALTEQLAAVESLEVLDELADQVLTIQTLDELQLPESVHSHNMAIIQ